MAVDDAYVFPGFLTPLLTQLFFPMPPTTFLTCFCRGERRKNAGKKSRLNWGSNSQSPDHESDTLTTVPPGLGEKSVEKEKMLGSSIFFFSLNVFCLLTHYHTMPHFEAQKIYSCRKHCEKRRNCL